MTRSTNFSVSYPNSNISAQVSATVQGGQITRLNITPLPGSKKIPAWAKKDIRAQVLRDCHAETEQAQAN